MNAIEKKDVAEFFTQELKHRIIINANYAKRILIRIMGTKTSYTFRTTIKITKKLCPVKIRVFTNFCVSSKAKNIYSCLEWVICGAHPYSFVEVNLNRKCANIELISRNIFVKYLGLLTQKVEESIKKALPPRFGLNMDGWSEASRSTHYVAIFAVFRDSSNQTNIDLLSFSPLLSEEELSADKHMELIDYAMGLFERT